MSVQNKENPTTQASVKEKKDKVEVKETWKAKINALWASIEGKKLTEETTNAITGIENQSENEKFEKIPLKTYSEVIKGTELEKKLTNILIHPDFDDPQKYPEITNLSAGERVEYIFRKINTTLSKFYARKFDIETATPAPEWLHQVLVPTTERFLLDILKNNKQENNINFLAQLWEIKLESLTNAFQWIKNFSEKFTLPYQKGKTLMKIIDFLSLPKQKKHLSKVNNPYDFYQKIMQNPIWSSDEVDINTLSFEQLGLKIWEKQEDLSNLTKIKNEIWSIQVVDSPETVKKILWLLGKSESYFTQTNKLSNQLLDSIDKVKSIDNTLQNLLGINIFKEIQESKFFKGVADFFLNILGFSGGLKGLERKWRKRNIDREINALKKEFITESYKQYLKEKEQIPQEKIQEIMKKYQLDIASENQSKFTLDIPKLETSILEQLNHPEKINPNLLSQIKGKDFDGKKFIEKTKDSKGNEILKVKSDFFSSKENKEKFIKLYIPEILQQLSKNSDFLKQAEDSDTIAFTVLSAVSLDKNNLIEGIRLGAIMPEDFYEAKEKTSKDINSVASDGGAEQREIIQEPSNFLNTAKEIIISGESEWQYGAVNRNDKGMASIGLIQRRWARAINLLQEMKNANTEKFESIMTDPLFKNLNQIKKPRTETQANQFKNLMKIPDFKNVMEQQINKDLSAYVNDIKTRWLQDPKAILATMRIYNAWPSFAKNNVIEKLWSEEKNNYEAIIAQYNKTSHGQKYQIFSKNNITETIKKYSWWIDIT